MDVVYAKMLVFTRGVGVLQGRLNMDLTDVFIVKTAMKYIAKLFTFKKFNKLLQIN